MEGEDIFSIVHLPCPSPVVRITQDIGDHDLQFRCQATWEEESSIFWVLPDNTTIVLPGLGEDERNANLTSQHFNISFQHDISACGWTWETPSRITTHCSHNQTAPNYAVRTVSVLVLHERLLHKWNGTSIRCGVKSISSDVVARRQLSVILISNKSKSQAKTASPGLMSLSYPPTPPDDAIATLTYYSSVVQSDNTSQAKLDNAQTSKEIATSLYEVYAPVTTSILNNTNSIDVDDFVILLPSETHKRLHPNYFIASFLCTVPFAFIFAACMYLQNRRYTITEDETMNEQESGQQQRNNDASVSENQRDSSVSDTIADPYYSTIHDSHESETVEPYGVAKVCPQYGRAETRSSDVRERVDAD
ncbi:hypothetical protein Bbelb_341820 [Branchiostoma belcheri]|nr:hypothetical protein Bbelb_341820 [Branchiostoma belcheri]